MLEQVNRGSEERTSVSLIDKPLSWLTRLCSSPLFCILFFPSPLSPLFLQLVCTVLHITLSHDPPQNLKQGMRSTAISCVQKMESTLQKEQADPRDTYHASKPFNGNGFGLAMYYVSGMTNKLNIACNFPWTRSLHSIDQFFLF